MSKKVKRKATVFGWMVKIVDILIYPVLFLALFSSFFMIVAKSKGVVSPIFDHTLVRVLTPSMSKYCEKADRSFAVNDIAFLSTSAKNVYQVGDVIAFYSDGTTVSGLPKLDLTFYQTKFVVQKDENGNVVFDENGKEKQIRDRYYPVYEENGEIKYNQELYDLINSTQIGETFLSNTNKKYYTKAEPQELKTLQQVKDDDKIVKFHQIMQIKIDTSGQIYYLTKGTNNSSADTVLVRQDLVVGRYVNTPKWLTAIVNFCGSSQGLIILVILPMSIIILIESLSILEQINNILLEKKVIARAALFDTKECEKAYIGLEMDEKDKIYLYDVFPPDYKNDLYDFLWGCLETSQHKKQKMIYETSQLAVDAYDIKDTDKYYGIWEQFYKSNRMKQKVKNAQVRAERDRYADVKIEEYQNYEPIEIEEPPKPKPRKRKTKQDYDKIIDDIIEEKDLEQRPKVKNTKSSISKTSSSKSTATKSAKPKTSGTTKSSTTTKSKSTATKTITQKSRSTKTTKKNG